MSLEVSVGFAMQPQVYAKEVALSSRQRPILQVSEKC